MKVWRWFVAVILVVVLVACKPEATSTPTGAPQAIETQVPVDVSPLLSPVSPLPTPFDLSEDAVEVVDTVRSLLAEEVGVPVDELTLLSIEAMDWRDASLGCPEPGKVYAQVIVSGWQVVFVDAGGTQYDVRTTTDLTEFLICESGDIH